tara:strand:- start:819 stop:1505 length:687 start_codon:yes stop_codon:yes gene_type:complete
MIISIIPARKNSKRIRNKNIKKFNGIPIINYPIRQIKNSKLFNKSYISTDSVKIKKIAEKLGLISPFLRQKKLSDDKIGIIKVIKNFIEYLNSIKIYPEYVCCIFSTAVFIKSYHLRNAYKILKNSKNIDYVFSAHKVDRSFLRSFNINKDFCVKKMKFPNLYNSRSQDLDQVFVDSGQFYFAKASTFLKEKKVFTSKSKIIDLSQLKVIDINYLEDWKKAEIILKKK